MGFMQNNYFVLVLVLDFSEYSMLYFWLFCLDLPYVIVF